MRHYQSLDTFKLEGNTVYLTSSGDDPVEAMAVMMREGERVAISISIGPLELGLRPRYEELQRAVASLKPVPGLSTTRHVGSEVAYMDLGLTEDRRLVMRPSLVSDASGHLSINLLVTPEAFEKLAAWLKG